MFNIPTYFETLFNLSKRNDWTTPKNLSESLTLLLFPNVKAYEYSGFYNKFYNGKNKGVLVYEGSQNEIKQVSHDKYIFKMADNFRSLNFKNKNFNPYDLQDYLQQKKHTQIIIKPAQTTIEDVFMDL